MTERKIVVDIWATDLHAAEIGIRKHALYQSKDRQFSKDLELFGVIREDKEKKGYLGFREQALNDSLENRRLVVKTFDTNIDWTGSLEEMVAREFTQTFTTKRSVPEFQINIADYEPLIALEAVKPRAIWPPQTYGFFIYHPEQKYLSIFRLRKLRFRIGDDWKINDITGSIVAKINGRILDFGGKFIITIFDEHLQLNDVFVRTLILFTGMLRFRTSIQRKLRKSIKRLKKGETRIKLNKNEVRLYKNPRRFSF
ncbi:MAG: hypothetical protein U9O98_10550 [Asgard group archaeon]|nr:hypothetical protein [Asgard group archaeon]